MVMAKDVDKGPKSGQGELAGAPRWTGWSGVLLVAGAVLALVQAVLWLGCTSMESGTEKEVRTPGSHSSAMTSTRAGGGSALALGLRAPQWVLPDGRGLLLRKCPRPRNRRGGPAQGPLNHLGAAGVQRRSTLAEALPKESCHPLRLTQAGDIRGQQLGYG